MNEGWGTQISSWVSDLSSVAIALWGQNGNNSGGGSSTPPVIVAAPESNTNMIMLMGLAILGGIMLWKK